MIVVSIYAVFDFKAKILQGQRWERHELWDTAQCTILAAGVDCTEKDTGFVCGYNAYPQENSEVDKLLSRESFQFDQGVSSCPGRFVCASEGYQCQCNGRVAYAPAVFNNQVTSPYVGKVEHKMSDGRPMMCSHNQDKGGAFSYDPKPYSPKFCFCTPGAVLDRIDTYESRTRPGKRTCAKEANEDFESQKKSRRLKTNPELLTATAPATREEDYGMQNDTQSRRLTSERRRRTYTFNPWALV